MFSYQKVCERAQGLSEYGLVLALLSLAAIAALVALELVLQGQLTDSSSGVVGYF